MALILSLLQVMDARLVRRRLRLCRFRLERMQVVDSARLTMKKRNFSFVLLVLTFIIVNVASETWNCGGSSLAGESTGKDKDTVQTEGNHTISVDE